MGVGLTSLGHLWTGRRRPHNHYVIGDSADTTSTAHSVGTAGRSLPPTGGPSATRRSYGGAAEHDAARFAGQGPRRRTTAELLGCNKSRHRRPQAQPGMLAIGRSRGGAARQLRHLGAPAADLDGGTASQVRTTAEVFGTTRLGITDCGPFKGRVFWWSRGSYVPEQAPQGAMGSGL
jgi:hypothetical protein